MSRYFIKKAITACLLFAVLFTGFFLNIRKNGKAITDTVKENIEMKKDVHTVIKNIENVIDENVFGKYTFIESYGYIQRLMNKNEENDFEVIKDKKGYLHYSYFEHKPKNLDYLAQNVKKYKESLKNQNTKFMYLMTPDKVIKGFTEFESGLPNNYANATADLFLESLSKLDIESFDFRDNLTNYGIAEEDLFYKTDHHWTIETAFGAFKELVSALGITESSDYTNLENYNVITYPSSFIGSMGRKTGVLYGGVDDFSLIYPKYPTDYEYRMYTNGLEMETKGRFEQALINMGTIRYQEDKLDIKGDKYASYLYGNQGIAHIKNKKNEKGPKILIVKDSFMVPVAAFLSTVCSEVYLIDPRYYTESITNFTNNIENLDYVFVSFTPQDLTEEFLDFD